ncbi:lysosomal membrane ascorbate-dependent ferrireductase CYB561A3 isoform X2 [Gambusia affinis]|nr:lysosomal membrane ascorbate-dependent ferrireductase CYB561A3 isoform X2 [Gambusia affinis]XP_043967001.1 lysosomal membrane ascorbate-dependent ferrireductase CYB561A3 isoform X2 [Gambusia affinis]XP_043967002.1 lysosomal membrane ascorbate-dependent ferrireductase CYB561A3 isoform X2 [Gambusia affinis]XP_043967003.1 lysosomal membrane ascorbate-dependent ferrireductase CYB561A3 isoform X2 [Gambusia affinis]XP_043967004.1 lysosomal membrane ascorbate-dependent ferrireductase CYB561A3 isofo
MERSGTPSPDCPGSFPTVFERFPLVGLSTEVENETPTQKNETIPTGYMRSTVTFYLCYLLCLALGLACVVCVCVWNSRWRGGFAWDGSGLQFNWHPVLMVTGLVVLYGYGAVVYRVPLTWGQNKLPWKLLHAALMLGSLIMSILGLCAVFDVHNANNTPNLYSLHSWIGITAVTLFALQWGVGFAGFLLPCSPVLLRKLLKPVHVWLGGSILLLTTAACISGINEKLFFVLKGNVTYSRLPPEGVLGNSLGALVVAFGLVVLKILSNIQWQRPDSRPGEIAYTPLQDEND